MIPVKSPRDDVDTGMMVRNMADDVIGLLAVIDGHDQDFRLGDACRMKQIGPRRISVVMLRPKPLQNGKPSRVVVNHGGFNPIRLKHPAGAAFAPGQNITENLKKGLEKGLASLVTGGLFLLPVRHVVGTVLIAVSVNLLAALLDKGRIESPFDLYHLDEAALAEILAGEKEQQ